MIIEVIPRTATNFGHSISELLRIMDIVSTSPLNEDVTIDLSNCLFSHPLLLVGLPLLIEDYRQQGYTIDINTNCHNDSFRRYLGYINFGYGLRPDEIEIENYQQTLHTYLDKTYIPIINFPAIRSALATPARDRFLSILHRHISNQLKLTGNIHSAVTYLLDESIANIVDHSNTLRGYMFAQFYPQGNYMDVCIADNGISLLGSYQKYGITSITTHTEAIQNAINGISTKAEEGRGFGIRTSKNMLVDGLRGHYFIFSGTSFMISSSSREEIIPVPINRGWKGTILSLRIPINNDANFDPSIYWG